ncbi:unnamed protein product [marine sediment metagenome]|uniref:Uncharacterized protein n=1 Tax=marine sediment metagenome TaxID=412755 RepID=X1SBQ5_9ZZZZ
MNGRNEENLKELFAKFLNSEQTEKTVEDFRKAEQIFLEHPAPGPDDGLIADIKSEIAEAVPPRQVSVFRRIAYKTAVVAAAVIVIAAISVKLLEKGGSEPKVALATSMIPEALWESDDISADDVELATFTAEIEQIEGEVLTLQWSENGGNGQAAVSELEMELIEISSNFWER